MNKPLKKNLIVIFLILIINNSCSINDNIDSPLELILQKKTTLNNLNQKYNDSDIKSIKIEPSKISLEEGQIKLILASITFKDNVIENINDNIEWFSEDEMIAKISPLGRLSAIKQGEVGIIAKYKFGERKFRTIAEVKENKSKLTIPKPEKTAIPLDQISSKTFEIEISLNSTLPFIRIDNGESEKLPLKIKIKGGVHKFEVFDPIIGCRFAENNLIESNKLFDYKSEDFCVTKE